MAGTVQSYKREGPSQELSLKITRTNHEKLQAWGASNRGALLRVHLCSRLCGGEKGSRRLCSCSSSSKDLSRRRRGLDEKLRSGYGRDARSTPCSRRRSSSTSRTRKEGDGGASYRKRQEGKEKVEKDEKERVKRTQERCQEGEKRKREREEGRERRGGERDFFHIEHGDRSEGFSKEASLSRFRENRVRSISQVEDEAEKESSKVIEKDQEEEGDLRQQRRYIQVQRGEWQPSLPGEQEGEDYSPANARSSASGQVWNAQEGPVAVHYFRTVLHHRMSGGIAREALTLPMIVDIALQGRIAESVDIAIQRLNALELISRGSDFRIARRRAWSFAPWNWMGWPPRWRGGRPYKRAERRQNFVIRVGKEETTGRATGKAAQRTLGGRKAMENLCFLLGGIVTIEKTEAQHHVTKKFTRLGVCNPFATINNCPLYFRKTITHNRYLSKSQHSVCHPVALP